MKNRSMFTSYRQDWKTPVDLREKLQEEFDFDYEPCSGSNEVDDLTSEWGLRNYLNPPYTRKVQDAFVKKAYEESCKGKIVVCLLPVRTSSMRWQKYILPFAKEIRFLPKRLYFVGAKEPSIFCSAIILFDGR